MGNYLPGMVLLRLPRRPLGYGRRHRKTLSRVGFSALGLALIWFLNWEVEITVVRA